MSGPQRLREYRAMVWTTDATVPGRRVTVQAVSLQEAKRFLEMEHGAGNVFDLHSEEDASKSRDPDGSGPARAAAWAAAAPLLAELDGVARTGVVAVVKVDGLRSSGIYTVVLSGGRLGDEVLRRDGDDLVALLREALSWFAAHSTAP